MTGFHVEVLWRAVRYDQSQLDRAAQIAWQMNRGKFTLCEPPEYVPPKLGETPLSSYYNSEEA